MAAKYKAFLIAILLSLALDQGSKIWARHSLKPKYPDVVTVIPGFFELRYSENTGSAFGLFRSLPYARYLFFVVGIGALWVVSSYLRRAKPEQRRLGVELGLLAGGAIGNIIDRAAFSRVTDFIVWKVAGHEWPTFNVADAALVLGVIGFLFDLRPDEKNAPAASKAQKRRT
ncbi:MAG TPA: signal peptidase II [Polyangia bacterium]|nr:signal peptidase II [Polyangia bacterium]